MNHPPATSQKRGRSNSAVGRARLAVAVTIVLAASRALAQQPPDPHFERQQVFESYQRFKDRLAEISSVSDADQRRAQLDALWAALKAAGQVPYAQGGQVAFLYRGAAASVSFPGDFNGWNPGAAGWSAARLPDTDLWILEKSFPVDARLDYKIVAGGSTWLLDPANPLQMWSGFGPNSELRMPEYQYPSETVRQADAPRGTLGSNVRTTSASLGYDVNYRVYTPQGYSPATSQNLPVVYVTDGHEYAADHMGSMVVVLDNLIAAGDLQPVIAVFIDPRDPGNPANNRRASQYVQNPKFLAFVAQELVPAIDGHYRTLASPGGRAILGTSLGGLNSAYFGAQRPDVFGNIAVQSPASFAQLAPGLLNLYATEPLQQKLDLFVSAGTIGDGNGGTSFAAALQQNGYEYQFRQTHEGHSWGQWRGLLDDALLYLIGPTPLAGADFNEDGAVDAADLVQWQAHVGNPSGTAGASHAQGDANGDRAVDGLDFLLWQRQQTAAPAPATNPLPEPSSARHGMTALLASLIRRPCRRYARRGGPFLGGRLGRSVVPRSL
ncbi:MAG: hypothetical protein IT424_10590 [Pirellulales bacterium]|nr:hypothetical protein [Pirellulales bacterium]